MLKLSLPLDLFEGLSKEKLYTKVWIQIMNGDVLAMNILMTCTMTPFVVFQMTPGKRIWLKQIGSMIDTGWIASHFAIYVSKQSRMRIL